MREPNDPVRADVFDTKQETGIIDEVIGRLAAGSESFHAREVTRETLLSEIVMTLEWDYAAAITGLFTDQWSGVAAGRHDGTYNVWVECYSLEAGVALAWKLIADNHEEQQKQEQ